MLFKSIKLAIAVLLLFTWQTGRLYPQENLREIFPDFFRPGSEIYYVTLVPVARQLALDDEQRLILGGISSALKQELEPSPSTQNDFNYLYSTFNAVQRERLDEIIVERNLTKMLKLGISEAFEGALQSNKGLEAANAFFSAPIFQKFLELTPSQIEQEEKSRTELIESIKKLDRGFVEELEDLYQRWQQALYGELIFFQKDNFDSALGDPLELPDQLQRQLTNFSRGEFWNTSSRSMMGGIINPSEIDLILQTPYYIDAPFQPHALFEILLIRDFVRDLDLSQHQVARVKALKQDWLKLNPLPESLKIRTEFGWSRTSKQQRAEAELANQELSEINGQVNEILNDKQQRRLKQIWNRILIEMGWKQVPLAFPDWRDYLELSETQRDKYDQINEKFTQEVQQLFADNLTHRRQAAADFNEVVKELLTEDQKQKVRRFLGNRL